MTRYTETVGQFADWAAFCSGCTPEAQENKDREKIEMGADYTDCMIERLESLKQLQRELESLCPSVELAREKSRAADRVCNDAVYKCRWLKKQLLEADTAAEFDDLLDQLHKAEDMREKLVREKMDIKLRLGLLESRLSDIQGKISRIRKDLAEMS